MSVESPSVLSFRSRCRVAHRHSTSSSYFTCESSHEPRPRTSPSHAPSSFQAPLETAFRGLRNRAQSSAPKYPEPYSEEPFLSLGELRRRRSSESGRSRAATWSALIVQQEAPPVPPLPASTPIVDAFEGVSESSQSQKSSMEEVHIAEVIGRPASIRHGSEATITGFRRPKRRNTGSSDLGSALHMLFGLRVGQVDSHAVEVCESPSTGQVTPIWDVQEQNVVVEQPADIRKRPPPICVGNQGSICSSPAMPFSHPRVAHSAPTTPKRRTADVHQSPSGETVTAEKRIRADSSSAVCPVRNSAAGIPVRASYMRRSASPTRVSLGPVSPIPNDCTLTDYSSSNWSSQQSHSQRHDMPVPPQSARRKPVPQLDTTDVLRDPRILPARSLPEFSLNHPSVQSFRSLPARTKSTKKFKRVSKIAISHSHLHKSATQQTIARPAAVGSEMTLPVGPKLVHSASVGSLRDVLLSGKSTRPRLSKQPREKQPRLPFEKYAIPNEDQLKLASELFVLDERGQRVRFGDLFADQKTAVCFIRHFWCPSCQDYMSSIVHLTEPSLVRQAGVKLVVISNGSPVMVKAYRDNVFHCPYEVYTDPSRKLYKTLGMTLRTTNKGRQAEKGSYIKHGTITGAMMVLRNALKMPLGNYGDSKQLGGEFILGPGLTCSFANRMHTTRSHTPIRDLLQAAGVDTNPWATGLSILDSETERARWMDAQSDDLDNMILRGMQASRARRRRETGDAEVDKVELGRFRRLLERLQSETLGSDKPTLVDSSYKSKGKGKMKMSDEFGVVRRSRTSHSSWVVV